MKKITAAFLVLSMLCAMTGCDKSEGGVGTPESSTNPESSTSIVEESSTTESDSSTDDSMDNTSEPGNIKV